MENSESDNYISNALIIASKNNNFYLVKVLVCHGADINFCNGLALQIASEFGYIDIVKYLVENGASGSEAIN
ncbi:ankyrin repeat domain-containing protein [Cotonvirus japonicus]|uniref:Ankyrin repeat domain-containing protein n=1 Tax=Cotonvirus japonicus TaxID=2811091 RepID=A0ABM7NRC8_9VIRU|nr:ankyrin repeat domain-containing protein [Cotonvirus japonicus]BCS82647.1 ankyrin repeat domain-containing protein [Cotonvirus japonicus]